MANKNLVDYDVLNEGVVSYKNNADNLRELVEAMVKMNGKLQTGWQNDTARAFVERFDSDHKPKLLSAADAIEEISTYIQKYLNFRQEEDSQGANAIRG